MKRFVLSAAFVASALAAAIPAQAAALPGQTFDVVIGLTTGCMISTAPANVGFTYVFNQGAPSALDADGSFGVKCTKNLTYTMALDGTGTYTDNATDLTYSLTIPGSATGTGAAQSHAITGSMAAGQSGTCAASAASCDNGASTNRTRTLTVSY